MVTTETSYATSAWQSIESSGTSRTIHQLSGLAIIEIYSAGKRVNISFDFVMLNEKKFFLDLLNVYLKHQHKRHLVMSILHNYPMHHQSPLNLEDNLQLLLVIRNAFLISMVGRDILFPPRKISFNHFLGQFILGAKTNAITHDKYTLGLLLNIENIHRDILRLDDDDDPPLNTN